jgi:peptidoglycan/xylan/chitin deacetylase (PgdA/CDA1 family)
MSTSPATAAAPGLILTFDDGPLDDKGKDVALKTTLDVLGASGIQGTFYVLGEEVKKAPTLARLIVDRGHSLQSHAFSHVELPKLPEARMREALQKTQDIIFQTTGVRPHRLRPPYGAGWVGLKSAVLIKVATELGLRLTGWDVDTNDWKTPRGLLDSKKFYPARQDWKPLSLKRGRSLDVLMHVNQDTARDLQAFILGLQKEGWEFRMYEDTPKPPSSAVA